MIFSIVWALSTFNHFNFKSKVRIRWNFKIAESRNMSCSSICIVRWAWQSSLITFSERWESNIKTLETLMSTNVDFIRCGNLTFTESFSCVLDNSSISKNRFPVECSPSWFKTCWSFAFLGDVDSNLWVVVRGWIVNVSFSIWSVDVWTCW